MTGKPHTFFCVDGHTAGNPVRLVAGGGPALEGATMSARRQDFLARYDWIRTGLMFEPRGHDMMSGAILYPPTRPDCDTGILYIETSGCLPMCGHGTIGAVTFMLERGLVSPATPGTVNLDTPAGRVVAVYEEDNAGHIMSVRLTNVPAFLAVEGVTVDCPELGELTLDIAYGGNFYAIVEPQANYQGLDQLGAQGVLRISPKLRGLLNETVKVVHPEDATIRGVSHIQWSDAPKAEGADRRNAVFYGEKAIDRSPCGTGTSARMAQLAAKGALKPGERFVHESLIGSLFIGRVEGEATVGEHPAIVPSIEGSAYMTGYNTIFLDERDPYVRGFQVV